jgi:hypothetical protein
MFLLEAYPVPRGGPAVTNKKEKKKNLPIGGKKR